MRLGVLSFLGRVRFVGLQVCRVDIRPVSVRCFGAGFGAWVGEACLGICLLPIGHKKRAELIKNPTLSVCFLKYGKTNGGEPPFRCERKSGPWSSTGLLYRDRELGHREILRLISSAVNDSLVRLVTRHATQHALGPLALRHTLLDRPGK